MATKKQPAAFLDQLIGGPPSLTFQKKFINAIESAPPNSTIGMSAPRQVSKTWAMLRSAFYACLEPEAQRCLFLVHDVPLAKEVFARFCADLSELPKGLVKSIMRSAGVLTVTYTNGSRFTVKVRTPGVGVGMKWDRIYIDEAQMSDASQMEALRPTMTHSKVRKVIMAGTPPTDDDLRLYGRSPFVKLRQEAYGTDRWIEYAAAKEYSPSIKTDLKTAKACNPSWPFITDFEGLIKGEREELTHEAYCRQRLGVWVMPEEIELVDPELKFAEVEAVMSRDGSKATRFFASVGVTKNSTRAYIVFTDGIVQEVVHSVEIINSDMEPVAAWLHARKNSIGKITLPANIRGNQIAEHLKTLGIGNKAISSNPGPTATKINTWLQQVKRVAVKVFETNEVKMAMTSFWLGVEGRQITVTVKASNPDSAALVLGLILAVEDAAIPERKKRQRRLHW